MSEGLHERKSGGMTFGCANYVPRIGVAQRCALLHANVTDIVGIASKLAKGGQILLVPIVGDKVSRINVGSDFLNALTGMRERIGIEPCDQIFCNLFVGKALAKCLGNGILVRHKEQLAKEDASFITFEIKLTKLFVSIKLVW